MSGAPLHIGLVMGEAEKSIESRLTNADAKILLHQILSQRKRDGEEDWPREYLVRLHGQEDTVQIFRVNTPKISMIPITKGDQLLT